MIVIASDDRNFNIAIDALQAKMLCAFLDHVTSSPDMRAYLIAASEQVNKDGFEILATDVLAAATSVRSTLGFWARQFRAIKPGEQPPPAEVAPGAIEGEVDSEKKEEPPKPLVN